MISYEIIKDLAASTFDAKGNVNEKVYKFVLNKLTKKELKLFLRRLKKTNSERHVAVKYEGNMTQEIKKSIESMYKDKEITYERDRSLGGGIMIIDNDLIVNYTIDSIIKNKTVSI